MKTLYIFDIDDTLFQTHALILVRDSAGQIVAELSNQEFNTYDLKDDESFDFAEFSDANKFERTSRPIEKIIGKVREYQKVITETESKIIFITARPDFDDREKFLDVFRKKDIDIDQIYIYRVGNECASIKTSDKKVRVIRKYLETFKYDNCVMFDDSMKNLEAFKALNTEYPEVLFEAQQVFHDGSTKRI